MFRPNPSGLIAIHVADPEGVAVCTPALSLSHNLRDFEHGRVHQPRSVHLPPDDHASTHGVHAGLGPVGSQAGSGQCRSLL